MRIEKYCGNSETNNGKSYVVTDGTAKETEQAAKRVLKVGEVKVIKCYANSLDDEEISFTKEPGLTQFWAARRYAKNERRD